MEGLSGDQISYAGQASETVKLKFDKEAIEGDVLISNISHTEDRLYIGFSRKKIEHICSSSCKVEAIFGLKFSYFERLNDSIKQLRREVIERIMPSAVNFSQDSFLDPDILDNCSDTLSLKHCSKDQVIALRTVISAPPSSPPVLSVIILCIIMQVNGVRKGSFSVPSEMCYPESLQSEAVKVALEQNMLCNSDNYEFH